MIFVYIYHFKKVVMKHLFLVLAMGCLLAACTTLSETRGYKASYVPITNAIDTVEDSVYTNILKPYKEVISSKLTEVLAYSDTSLISFRPESPLSNFLSDLILQFGVDFCKAHYPDVTPQLSLYNHGGIRSSIPKGPITMGNVFELMPFENELSLVLLTGEQVIELANYITTRGGEGVAGISFGMVNNRADNIRIQGTKVDEKQKYWLIASDYIVNGGDGMKVFTWAERRIDTGQLMRDAIIAHLRKLNSENKKVTGKSDRRIYNVE